jgi:translocation and assembly module TamB
MARLGRLLRWALFAIGGLAGVVVLVFVAVFGLAQSEAGRAWIAATLTRAVSTPGELEITLDRLEGSLPRSLSLHGLSLADGDGVWLTIETAALDWRPAALFDRTLHVTEISVTGLNIARAPTSPAQPDDASSEDFAIPSLPVAVVLERLSVADLVLGAPVLGVPVSYRITGHGASEGTESLNLALTVERSDGVAGRVAVEAAFDLSQEHLRANLELTEPAGGLVAQLADQPDLPALALSFSGDGSLAQWRGHLSATAEGLRPHRPGDRRGRHGRAALVPSRRAVRS